MNKLFVLIVGMVACVYVIYKAEFIFTKIGAGVVAVGGLLNLLVVLANKLKMPLYDKRGGEINHYQESTHYVTSDKNKIKLFYLCDCIPIPKTKLSISVRDILMLVGFIFVLIGEYGWLR